MANNLTSLIPKGKNPSDTDSKKINIRYMELEDVDAVHALEKKVFYHTLESGVFCSGTNIQQAGKVHDFGT